MNEKITLITDLVLKLDDSKLSEKIVSSVQEYSGQLLPLIVDIYNGKDVMSHYNDLDQTKKLVVCIVACSCLANELDKSSETDSTASINNVGKFLKNVSNINALVAARSQIGLERLIKHELDIQAEWQHVIAKIGNINFNPLILDPKKDVPLSWEDVLNKAENDGN
jgi:hypothetical protein